MTQSADVSVKRRALVEALLAQQSLVQPNRKIPRRERRASAPLSFGQERLWFLEQAHPGSGAYNMPALLAIEGKLDAALLEASLRDIVARHEGLRTTFVTVDGIPVQQIAAKHELSLARVDLRQLPAAERPRQAGELARQTAVQPFDLARGPLIRATLLQLDAELYQLVLTMHHIISDAWSYEVLLHELAALYTAHRQQLPASLPEIDVQYADFAVWQREQLKGDALQRESTYWRTQLERLPLLNLPTDRPRPLVGSFRGQKRELVLPRAKLAALTALGQQEDATPFMLLLAVYASVLQRYSGQTTIAVGCPVANRRSAELEGLIGFFVNSVVVRVDCSGDPSFVQLLRRVRQTVLDAYTHQDLPFEKVVELVQPERDPSRNPLFQVGFSLQHAETLSLHLPDFTLRLHEIDNGTAKFDLMLSIEENPSTIAIHLNYNCDLFDASTIDRFLGHFQAVLEAAALDPTTAVAAIPLLSPAELQQLQRWNENRRAFPEQLCAHELFEAQVARRPDATAATFRDRQLSYRALNRRANQLATELRALGVGPEVNVGICMEGSLEVVIAILAVLKAGGAYVPLDAAYPRQRLASMIEDAALELVLTQSHLEDCMRDLVGCALVVSEREPGAAFDENPRSGAVPTNACYTIFTSGSTGRPKGVVIEHRGLVSLVTHWAELTELGPGSRVLQFASLSFDVSVLDVFSTLSAGAALVLETREAMAVGEPLVEVLQRRQITAVILPPSVWKHLPDAELPSLRMAITGGEVCPQTVADRWGRGRTFINAYGPTETTICSSLTRCTPGVGKPAIGRSLPNIQFYVVNSHLQLCPVGVPGELLIGGVGLARGYLERPEATARAFIDNPFPAGGRRLYRTGDLVRWLPDGQIDYLQRIDTQVKLRGLRIELGEIETALTDHPSVAAATVICYTDASDDKQLAAYVVAARDAVVPAPDELKRTLLAKLPSFMVPHLFIVVDSIPLTAAGKADLNALPPPELQRTEQPYEAPRNTLERAVTDIWQAVLKRERVGVHDNFFELGGHSLLVTRITGQLRELLAIDLPITTFFSAPTVAGLSDYIQSDPELAAVAEPRAKLLTDITALSDEEIERKLAERAAGSGGELHPLIVPFRVVPAQPAFFCVHPGSGNVLSYVELTQHMDPELSFYAIQPRGFHGEHPLIETVQEMAALYIEAIASVNPQGPYRLGGWSFGGLVAFEMARQLRAAGATIELVVLIDTQVPPVLDADVEISNALIELKYAWDLANFLELPISQAELEQLPAGAHLPHVLALVQASQAMPRGFSLDQLEHSIALFKNNTRAMFRYRPEPSEDPLAVIQAGEWKGDDRPSVGWTKLAAGDLQVRTIAGNHYSIMKPPQVKQLATVLSGYLRQGY